MHATPGTIELSAELSSRMPHDNARTADGNANGRGGRVRFRALRVSERHSRGCRSACECADQQPFAVSFMRRLKNALATRLRHNGVVEILRCYDAGTRLILHGGDPNF